MFQMLFQMFQMFFFFKCFKCSFKCFFQRHFQTASPPRPYLGSFTVHLLSDNAAGGEKRSKFSHKSSKTGTNIFFRFFVLISAAVNFPLKLHFKPASKSEKSNFYKVSKCRQCSDTEVSGIKKITFEPIFSKHHLKTHFVIGLNQFYANQKAKCKYRNI